METIIDWNSVVADIGPKLYQYFCASFPRPTAADLVQEVFIRLVNKYNKGSYDPKKGSLRMFAFGIAHFVRLETLKALPKENLFGDPTEYEWQMDANEKVDGNEEMNRRFALRKAITRLSGIQQQIILLLIDKELTLTDIGEITKIPLNTVKSHVHRAKDKLRTLLMNTRGI